LFFVVSGISVYFSLTRRSVSQFAKERARRLMLPFIVGLLIVLPADAYYHALSIGAFQGGFVQFTSGPYFTRFFPFTLSFSPAFFAGPDQGIYLWYLFWLFIFSLVTVHLFKWLGEEEHRNKLSKLYALCNRRGGILLLAFPIVLVNIVAIPPYFIPPSLVSGYGGWKLPTYLAFFITAYVMACNPQFEESVEKNRVPALLLGIVTSVLAIGAFLIAEANPAGPASHYLSVSTFQALNGWFWVVAIMGFGRKHLSFNHKFLGTSNELVLPFYVLHQSVIVGVAYYVIGMNLMTIEKFLLTVFASFPIILALLYPINRVNALRFLFGMRSTRKEK